MTRQELNAFYGALIAVGNLQGVKFAYAIAKTKNHCEPEIKAMQAALKPSEKFVEFENKRVELCKEHCKKDEDNKPIKEVENGQEVFQGLEGNSKFEKTLEKLKKEYKKEIDERETQSKDFEKMLKEEVKIDIHKVKLEHVPEEITPGQMDALMVMIEE